MSIKQKALLLKLLAVLFKASCKGTAGLLALIMICMSWMISAMKWINVKLLLLKAIVEEASHDTGATTSTKEGN